MDAIPNKINLLSKIFSSSDFPLMETYRVILSMRLSNRVRNNVARNSSGSWNTKALLFLLVWFLVFFFNVFRWKAWVRKSLRGYIHQHLTKTSSMWNSILQWLCFKECPKEFSRLPKQVHVHQVVTGLQKANKNVHQKNPPWSWPISCNFLTSVK